MWFEAEKLTFHHQNLKACQIKTHFLGLISMLVILVWVTDQTYFLWKKIFEENPKSSTLLNMDLNDLMQIF